jgi:hypothetical protein
MSKSKKNAVEAPKDAVVADVAAPVVEAPAEVAVAETPAIVIYPKRDDLPKLDKGFHDYEIMGPTLSGGTAFIQARSPNMALGMFAEATGFKAVILNDLRKRGRSPETIRSTVLEDAKSLTLEQRTTLAAELSKMLTEDAPAAAPAAAAA